MKLLGIACVRDEADVIESFVRHTLCFVDKLFVIDNMSCDRTLEILVHLINEGLNLEVRTFQSNQHKQDAAISTVINELPQQDPHYDFAVLLDADEFIGASSRSAFLEDLARIGPEHYPVMEWKTYIPAAALVQAPQLCLTHSMIMRREPEGQMFHKAVVPARLFGHCIVGLGNHFLASARGEHITPKFIATRLAHFPVRSPAQALCKLILGSHTLQMKADRGPNEGKHWDALADQLRANNYTITQETLAEFATYYCQEPSTPFSLVRDPMPSFPGTDLRYVEMSSVSPLQRFDAYIRRLHQP